MTWLSILSAIFRFIGLARWADSLWEKHEIKVRTKEVCDAVENIARASDADVVKQLRNKYTRD